MRSTKALFVWAAAWTAACHPSRVRGTDGAAGPTSQGSLSSDPSDLVSASFAGPGLSSAPAAFPFSPSGPGGLASPTGSPGPAPFFASGARATPASAAPDSPGTIGRAPFGTPSVVARYGCPDLQRGGRSHPYLAVPDTSVAFVDGDDWLALVNRSPTGALSPDYAPADLVDLKDGRPHSAAECGAKHECLRRDAAAALRRMFGAMRQDGLEGYVVSAFRAFGTQCWVFESWARQAHGGFCEAAEQSALPGHSQHQLGTTLDLFTKSWADEGARTGRGVFRDGFGCTPGGRWLDQQSWRFGFVVPYSIHPDDRVSGSRCAERTDRFVPIDPKTGYKSEPWHLRFIGLEAAARYHEAWLASGPGTPDEITLEQWIRAQRGLPGDTELPVCDGCHCGECATLASDDAARSPCGEASLRLDGFGRIVGPAEDPRLIDARVVASSAEALGNARRDRGGSAAAGSSILVLEAVVRAPAHTPTQTPVFGRDEPVYGGDQSYLALVPYAGTLPHRYPDLPGAWRIAVDTVPPAAAAAVPGGAEPAASAPDAGRWPWRASLASPALEAVWNRANVVLPARAGDVTIRIPLAVPPAARALAVTLLRDGAEHDTRQIALP